jgi:hypothetical protein
MVANMTASYRYLLRPRKFLTTPKRLAEKLGIERIYHTGRMGDVEFDPDIDLIMAWPSDINFPSPIRNVYGPMISFYNSNKREQRAVMKDYGISTPERFALSDKWVKRPLHHHGGNGFEIVTLDECPDKDNFYYSPVFPKTHEYRMIYVCGQLSVILTKQIDDRNPEIPWNHANGSRFVTTSLARVAYKNMRYLDEDLRTFFVTQNAPIVAYDVMYDDNSRHHAVCEANFAPALTIDTNLDTVVQNLREGFPCWDADFEEDFDDGDIQPDYQYDDDDSYVEDDSF